MSLSVADYLQDQVVLRSQSAPLQPDVTVVLPTYARLKSGLMPRAVESVLNQTLTNIELIIVDDGSSDGSNEYIENLRARDPRVVHIRHEQNSGLPGLRCNEAIEIARGRYVAFQFDDDFWYPHALDKLLTTAEQQSQWSVIVGKVSWYEPSGDRRGVGVLPKDDVHIDTMFRDNQIANCSVLLPRPVFDQYGMYDPHLVLRRLCDWDLWIRLIEHIPFTLLDEFIGEVDSGKADSIGMTIPFDKSAVRFFQQIPRGDLLTPANWRKYVVDAVTIGDVALPEFMIQRAYENQFVPYYSRFRHNYPQVGSFRKNAAGRRRNGVVIASNRTASNHLVIESYDQLACRRDSVKVYQDFTPHVDPRDLGNADAVNFFRVTDPFMGSLVKQLPPAVATASTLDDNYLLLHEVDHHPEFQIGHRYQASYVHNLGQVDAVWCATEPIRESVRQVNPRTLRLPGAIPAEWLPRLPLSTTEHGPLKVFYAGGAHREREFKVLWTALQKIASEFPGRLEFEFWGADVSTFPALGAPVKVREFTLSYLEYVDRLRDTQFHIMLAPLLVTSEFYRGKSNPKYMDCAITGAVGIFSDIVPYRDISDGLTCIKAENTSDGWEAALRRAIEMPAQERDRLRENCVQHVRETRTVEAQIGFYEAAWRATEIHGATRDRRGNDGRPCVLFVMDEVPFDFQEQTALIELAADYSYAPVVLLSGQVPSPIRERLQKHLAARSVPCHSIGGSSDHAGTARRAPDLLKPLLAVIEQVKPAIVHNLGSNREVARACRSLGLPYVHCLTPVTSTSSPDHRAPTLVRAGVAYTSSFLTRSRYSTAQKTQVYYLHAPVAPPLFEAGFRRSLSGQWGDPLRIVAAGHSAADVPQLGEAMAQLRVSGINVRLELLGAKPGLDARTTPAQSASKPAGELITSSESAGDSALQQADVLLYLGTPTAFPHIVREAMASGVLALVGSSDVVQEHIQPNVTGLVLRAVRSECIVDAIEVIQGLPARDRLAILNRARHVALDEFHPHQSAASLLDLYHASIVQNRPSSGEVVPANKLVSPQSARSLVEETGDPPRTTVRIHGRVRYVVRPGWDDWNGLEIMLGTHQQPATGTLHLAIYEADGPLVREASLPLDAVSDNQWALFAFQPLPFSASHEYRCEFSLKGTDRRTKISFYETSHPHTLLFHRKVLWRVGLPQDRVALAMRFHYNQ